MVEVEDSWNSRADAPIVKCGLPLELGKHSRVHLQVQSPSKASALQTEALLVRGEVDDALIVSLHGYTERYKYTMPRFERLASFTGLNRNVLYVSDPTLALNSQLALAWYVGTAAEDATARIARIIENCAEQLGIDRIIITGSSGGGFASLALAAQVPGSKALVYSPQTRISSYWPKHVESFRKRAFPEYRDIQEVEIWHRPRVDMQYLYQSGGGEAWYVQNSGDPAHIKAHYLPFRKSARSGVQFFMEHHRVGHGPPSRDRVVAWVEAALCGIPLRSPEQ